MKKYVYLEKEDDLIIAHAMIAENRLEVKKKTGVCIDNIYSFDLIVKVHAWLSKKGIDLICEDGHTVFTYINKRLHYIESFVEFRNLVSDYRER